MKIPNEIEVIVVDFASGSQASYFPTSKVEEFEECYEFSEVLEGKNKMVVIMKHQVRNITFISK